MAIHDMDAVALAARLKEDHPPVLLDVRERWEYDRAKLPNAKLVPLAQLQEHVGELDANAEYVVYCHHGGRSAMAAQFLKAQGFAHVVNLEGGIDGWSLEVDESVARY